jgi:hypothetical protein
MGFVPDDFEVPELLEHERFRVRPLTVHDVVKDYDAEVWLYRRWLLELWNGDLSVAAEIVTDDFVVHQARADGAASEELRGPEAVLRMVREGHAPPAGTAVEFAGIDLLRLRDGRFAEYRVSSDGLQLMAQLGALGPGP